MKNVVISLVLGGLLFALLGALPVFASDAKVTVLINWGKPDEKTTYSRFVTLRVTPPWSEAIYWKDYAIVTDAGLAPGTKQAIPNYIPMPAGPEYVKSFDVVFKIPGDNGPKNIGAVFYDSKFQESAPTFADPIILAEHPAYQPAGLKLASYSTDKFNFGQFILSWDTPASAVIRQGLNHYVIEAYSKDRDELLARWLTSDNSQNILAGYLDKKANLLIGNAYDSARFPQSDYIDGVYKMLQKNGIIDDSSFLLPNKALAPGAYDYSGNVWFPNIFYKGSVWFPSFVPADETGYVADLAKANDQLNGRFYIRVYDKQNSKIIMGEKYNPNDLRLPMDELRYWSTDQWTAETKKYSWVINRNGTQYQYDEYGKQNNTMPALYSFDEIEKRILAQMRNNYNNQLSYLNWILDGLHKFNGYFPAPEKEPNYKLPAKFYFIVKAIYKDGTESLPSRFEFHSDFYPPALPLLDTSSFPKGELKEIKTLTGTCQDAIPDNSKPGIMKKGGSGLFKVEMKTQRTAGDGKYEIWGGNGWIDGAVDAQNPNSSWFPATIIPSIISVRLPNEDGGNRWVWIRTTDPDKWTINNSSHEVKAGGEFPNGEASYIYYLPPYDSQNLNNARVSKRKFAHTSHKYTATTIWNALVKAGYIDDSTGAIKPSFDNLAKDKFSLDLDSDIVKARIYKILRTAYSAAKPYSYDIYKRSMDNAGNLSPDYEKPDNVTSIILYRQLPSVNFSIKAPVVEGFTYSRSVSLSFKNPDDRHAPLAYQVRNENDKDYVDCTAKLNQDNEYAGWTIPEGEGKKTVYARVTDRLGNVFETSAAIVLDLTPPTGTIVINDGQPYTNNKNIKLHLKAEDAPSGINTMSFSDDNGENWIQPVAYAETYDWNLSADGNKTLLVQFMDKAGNNIGVSATIYLDTTTPDLRLLTPSDGDYLSDLQLITGEAWDVDPDDYKKKGGSGVDKVRIRLKKLEAENYSYWNWGQKKWEKSADKDNQSVEYWKSGIVTPENGTDRDKWSISANLPTKDDWTEGDYEISAKAFDKAGNPSNYSRTSSVTIQKSPPSNAELNLKGPVGWVNGRIDEPAEFRWDTPKNAVSYYWSVNKPPTPDLKPIEENKIILDKAKLLPNAENTFYLAAANKAGVADFAGAASYKFKYDPDSPPKPELSISPINWMNAARKDLPNVKGWTVSWKEQANNPSGIAIAHWKLDDKEYDRAAAVNNSVKINPSSFNLADGTHKVTVYLEDGAGNSKPVNTAEVMLYYDNTNPTAPNAPCNAWKDNIKNPPEKIQTNAPFNYAAPYFEWSGAQDQLPGSGIRGYMVYFGPVEDDKLAVNLQPDANYQAKQLAPGTYYLIVKTVDWAGNESSGITLFKYIYDQNAVNFPPLVPSNVTLNKNNLTGKLVLSWDAVNLPFDRKAESYNVYKSKDPSYFNRYFSFYSGPETTTTDDIAAEANYYIVTAQNKAGESDSSKVFGYNAANLAPGSNWVSIPFVNAKMSRAADIWTSLGLEAGDKIEVPEAGTEKIINSYNGINGDFAVQWGKNYRVTTAKRRIWVMAGQFGNDETGLFRLVQGINWIYLPYAKADIKTAKKLWQDLGLSYGDRIEAPGVAQGFYGGEYQDPDFGLTKIGNENLPIQTYQSYRIIVNSQLVKPNWP